MRKGLTILNIVIWSMLFIGFVANAYTPTNFIIGFLLFHVAFTSVLDYLEIKREEEVKKFIDTIIKEDDNE